MALRINNIHSTQILSYASIENIKLPMSRKYRFHNKVGGAFAGLVASYQAGDWAFSLGGGTNFRTYNVGGGVGYNDGL
ncbi:MAG: hypothetical protein JSS64_02355, partial [Bacteroidetes bacterium]|nr:hypothetical protein [Bacteroidota bacterium]